MSPRGARAARPRWIAEERVVFVRPDGARAPGRIVVGAPEIVTESEARCPVALEGLEERVWWIHGGSTLQALALGERFLHALLQSERDHGLRVCFAERGGRLVDVPVDAIFGRGLGEADRTSGTTGTKSQDEKTGKNGRNGKQARGGGAGERVSRRSGARPRSRRSS